MLVAYLTLDGTTKEAFDFYADAMNAKITRVAHFSESPMGAQLPEADQKKIMHISLEGPEGIRLMGSDHIDSMGEPYQKGNHCCLSLHPHDKETADRLFHNLSAEGRVIVPIAAAPWGAYFGMFIDKFGVKWMINQG